MDSARMTNANAQIKMFDGLQKYMSVAKQTGLKIVCQKRYMDDYVMYFVQ